MSKQVLRKITICHNCHGEGTIKVGNLREMHNHDKENCPTCGGTGKVRRIVTIEFERI